MKNMRYGEDRLLGHEVRERWLEDSLDKDEPLTSEESLQAIEDTLYKIWDHPLVTEELIAFRQEGKRKIEELLKQVPLEGRVVAVPVGSAIWAINEKSDHDYVVMTETREDARSLQLAASIGILDVFENNKEDNLDVHTLPISPEGFSLLYTQDNVFSLLVTPDQLLSGDLLYAADIRKTLMDPEKIGISEGEELFDNLLEAYFVDRVKAWPFQSTGSNKGINMGREDRYNARVDLRASQSGNPDRYRDAFERVWSDFKTPSYTTLQKALELTDGRLEFPQYEERYATKHIV